ncbi:peptide chain release factor N(5)-glutamine methyltransferase [Patiriisocius sp. Uisw_017]|jgi:release factor glutamine methyltransferase|uniref:peptide chain release factor N(5)-glutamine methyltransferase n=1 Tax=Patiriisocius sp. Uisw_017 TaxID=3230968 RepID=UPI0039E8901A
MKLKQLQILSNKSLKGLYSTEEINAFFRLLAEAYLSYTRFEVYINKEKELDEDTIAKFEDASKRLRDFEPIQYILGETEFYGLPFKVTKDTLIPRPETEELVALITSEYKNDTSGLAILDIGTGSGCIAISIAKTLLKSKVSAIDISAEALKVAKQNATSNKVLIAFKQQDILATEKLSTNYDIIVSNPPYVRELEKELMQDNVLNFEPEKALFVSNEDPLVFYKKISQLAIEFLRPQGSLFFEINEYLGPEMEEMLNNLGFSEVLIHKDMFHKNRFAQCQK